MTYSSQPHAETRRQETMDAAVRDATRRCRQTGFQLRCIVCSVHLENCAKIACSGGDLPLAAMGAIPAPPTRQVVDKIATREV